MIYLMLVRVGADADPDPADADPSAWVAATEAAGQRLHGERLRPPQDATCVRVREGRTMITHGPFVEVTEQIAGFDLLEAADLDEAIAIAAAHPVARFGALELRELEAPEDPATAAQLAELAPHGDAGGDDATYLLLMGSEPGAPSLADADVPDEGGLPMAWIHRWGERDADRGGAPLRPASEAATVRVRDGRTLVTRGPFAELAEHVAGYNLLAVADLDEAIEAAAEHPGARLGVIEIRPLWPF